MAPSVMDDVRVAFQALQRGDVVTAERIVTAALQRNGRDVSALIVLAMIEAGRGNLEAAARGFERAVELQPSRADAHFNLGLLRSQLGRGSDAILSFEHVIRLDPANLRARLARADLLFAASRWPETIAAFDEIVKVQPSQADHWLKRGVALRGLNLYDAALDSFRRAQQLAPHDAVCHGAVGGVLTVTGRFSEAIESLSHALLLQPDFADAYLNRAMAYRALRQDALAVADFERAFALASADDPRVLIGYVTHLHRLGRADQVEDVLRRAQTTNPVLAAMVRGNWLGDRMQNDAALAAYEQALTLKPDDAMTIHARGLLRLRMGDLQNGFRDFEARLDGHIGTFGRMLPGEVWQPDSGKPDHSLLVYGEQGLGDIVQFVRFVPLLVERGHEVTLLLPPELVDLCRSLHPSVRIIARGQPLPHIDARCSLVSLPAKLGITTETLPARVPYLQASAEAAAQWRQRIGAFKSPRIGLCWCGSIQHDNDALRSIPLAQFRGLLPAGDAASFIRLQKDLRPEDAADLASLRLTDVADELKSLDDAAAVIEALDLVISVDTSIANLAGALGKPVWILLPFAPDWRWQTQRTDSIWYPTARLYRQARFGDWSEVISRVRTDLAAWIARWKV